MFKVDLFILTKNWGEGIQMPINRKIQEEFIMY